MSADLRQLSCCGVNELCSISSLRDYKDPLQVLYAVLIPHARLGRTPPRAFFLFTAARAPGATQTGLYGETLANAITKADLGTVTATDWVLNPNSGNEIKLYTWRLNHPNLLAWMKKTFAEFGTGNQPQPTLQNVPASVAAGVYGRAGLGNAPSPSVYNTQPNNTSNTSAPF